MTSAGSGHRTVRRLGAVVAAMAAVAVSACGANHKALDDPGLQLAAPATTSVAAAPASADTTSAPTTLAPTTLAPTTAATAAPTTLPTPEAPPPEDRVEADQVVGDISIPKIGLDLSMREGITLPTLDKGPGHWPGTAMPGQIGNVVVAGHRVSSTRPFRKIDQLVEGDEVLFTVGTATYRYVVTSHEIVTPDAMRIVDQTPDRTATLFACHPPGSAQFRWVVHLKLVDA